MIFFIIEDFCPSVYYTYANLPICRPHLHNRIFNSQVFYSLSLSIQTEPKKKFSFPYSWFYGYRILFTMHTHGPFETTTLLALNKGPLDWFHPLDLGLMQVDDFGPWHTSQWSCADLECKSCAENYESCFSLLLRLFCDIWFGYVLVVAQKLNFAILPTLKNSKIPPNKEKLFPCPWRPSKNYARKKASLKNAPLYKMGYKYLKKRSILNCSNKVLCIIVQKEIARNHKKTKPLT